MAADDSGMIYLVDWYKIRHLICHVNADSSFVILLDPTLLANYTDFFVKHISR